MLAVYGLHTVGLPVQVGPLPPPPSARTTVGITSVFRSRTAVPRMSNMRFIGVFSFSDNQVEGDGFTSAVPQTDVAKIFERSEFVTR